MTTMNLTTPVFAAPTAALQSELDRIRAGVTTSSTVGVGAGGLDAVAVNGQSVDDSFSDYLALARETFNSNGADGSVNEIKNNEDVVRAGARELVATAFFAPLFKMMREDPLRSDLVPMSSGEKMFGPMLHAEFAKEITSKGNFPLVEAIVRSLLPASAEKSEAKEAADETDSPSDDNQASSTAATGNVANAQYAATTSRQSELKQQTETVNVHG